jgi:hypothetical protein
VPADTVDPGLERGAAAKPLEALKHAHEDLLTLVIDVARGDPEVSHGAQDERGVFMENRYEIRVLRTLFFFQSQRHARPSRSE